MGPAGVPGGAGFPAPPSGFAASSDPVFAQNASTGQAAFLDPLTNTWTIDEPLFGFVPDPSAPGPMTYVDPVSGQQLQYYGYGTWVDPLDHRPPIFHYDPGSGRTAWFNPSTGQWVAPTPPPGYWADVSQPPSRTGFFYVDAKGHTAYYSTRDGAWTNWGTGQAVPVSTVERPGTGDAAGRVALPPGPTPTPGRGNIAQDSVYSSRLFALTRGDQSVPTGRPARDYTADVQNLAESKALRQQMIDAGANPFDISIIDTHIADLEKYVSLWDDHLDETGKFVHGGATAVNDAAQMDDLGAEMKQTGIIADSAVGAGGGALVNTVTGHIEATGIGGGGARTVVPKYRTAGQYLVDNRPPGSPPPRSAADAGQGAAPPAAGVAAVGQGAGAQAPAEAQAGAQSQTKSLPAGEAGEAAGSRAARATEKTEVGRPSEGDLAAAQQRASNRQDVATGWHGGPDDAVKMEVEAHEADVRARAMQEMDTGSDAGYYTPLPGETPEAAAARIGKWESLNNTPYEGRAAVIKLRSTRQELEGVTSGQGKSPSSQRSVDTYTSDLEATLKNVEEGERIFPDYWDRMQPSTRAELQAELDATRGKGGDYWTGRLRDYQTSRGAQIGGVSTPDVPMAPVPPATTLIPSTGPHVSVDLGGGGSSTSGSASSATMESPTGSAIRVKNVRFDATSEDGTGRGMLGRIRLGVVTPVGFGLVIGLGALGAFGGANVLGSPSHQELVPAIGGPIGPATPPPGPLTISAVTATLSADGQSTTFQITVTNVLGFQGTNWSMAAPAGAPDCNHLTMGGGMATWHHGAADGCGGVLGGSAGIPGQLTVNVSDGSGFRCTATYSGSLSGTGPPPTCKGGFPTMNPNLTLGGGSTTPSSTLVSRTVPASLSIWGAGLGGILGIALGFGLLGAVIPVRRKPATQTRSPAGGLAIPQAAVAADDAPAAAPPKPIMPAAGKKKKRSCQLELDALNRADRALQKARAAARAANDAVTAAQDAVSAADSAKSGAEGLLNLVQNPLPGQAPPRVQEGSFKLRQIVRQNDNQGNPLAPTADDVKDLDAGFSHVMTLGEAQRAVDQATADLAQAKANLAAAQAAARSADAAVDVAVKAYEDAREAYGKCLQLQREGI